MRTTLTAGAMSTCLGASAANSVVQVSLSRSPARSLTPKENVRSVTQGRSQRLVMASTLVDFAPAVIKTRKWWSTALPPVTGNASVERVISMLTLNPLNSAARVASVPRGSRSSRNAAPQRTRCAVRLGQIKEIGYSY